MAGRKFEKFNGYKETHIRQAEEIKIPKVYKINGYYYIGEEIAMYFKDKGAKVEEVR